MNSQSQSRKNIEKITWIGLWTNVILSLIKLVIGIAGSSQAVVADALHSFSDTGSDLMILFGVRYWTAPPGMPSFWPPENQILCHHFHQLYPAWYGSRHRV